MQLKYKRFIMKKINFSKGLNFLILWIVLIVVMVLIKVFVVK